MTRTPGPTRGKAADGAAGPGYYDGIFKRVKGYRCHPRNSRHNMIWKVVVDHTPPEARVLEVGCGPGQLALSLYEKGVRKYFGFDFSPVAVAEAKKRCPNFKFALGDARDQAMYDSFNYDLVVTTEVMEHLDDDMAVFDKIRPKTRILLTVPSTGVEKSHVRYFESVADVQAQYRHRLRRMKVGVVNNGEWYFVQGFVR